MRATRKSPIRAAEVRLLAGLILPSGIGQLISLVRNGRPHSFQEVRTALEFIVPAVFFQARQCRGESQPRPGG
jgi:hypothetical protein